MQEQFETIVCGLPERRAWTWPRRFRRSPPAGGGQSPVTGPALASLQRQRRDREEARQASIMAAASASSFWQAWRWDARERPQLAADEFRKVYETHFGAPPAPSGDAGAGGSSDPASPPPLRADGAEMEAPFAEAEVAEAVAGLRKKRRKPVVGFLSLDALIPLVQFVMPALTAVFNVCARLCCLPPAWVTRCAPSRQRMLGPAGGVVRGAGGEGDGQRGAASRRRRRRTGSPSESGGMTA
jgi:hypothetical protein